MTYGKLKTLASALLVGDNKLSKEDESIKALLEMAYNYLVDKCQVLNLHTEDKSENIQRLGRGTFMLRRPEVPKGDNDELDIDEELCPAVACLIASYISDKRIAVHQARADEIIRGYNAKVDELIESSKEITGEVV